MWKIFFVAFPKKQLCTYLTYLLAEEFRNMVLHQTTEKYGKEERTRKA